MSDTIGSAPRSSDDWSVFDDLAQLDEAPLRRRLRSHREAGLTWDRDGEAMALRRRLDGALDRLMWIEVATEMGMAEPAALPDGDGLVRLLHSAAFARYLNAYLYFGVRFAAHRVLGAGALDLPVDDAVREQRPHAHAPRGGLSGIDARPNDLPVALVVPPDLRQDDGSALLDRWTGSSGRPDLQEDVREALDFLDDFAAPGEQAEYELWLRGLSDYPADHPRFLRLTSGLLEFARGKAEFYTALEGERRLSRWKARGFASDAWSARQPLTARFGLLDLYWMARLLRAEVSSAGMVSFGEESWLTLLAERHGEGAAAESAEVMRRDAVLRAVFGFTCDLLQNAVAVTADAFERAHVPSRIPEWPDQTVNWRTACDEELDEVARQRRHRRFDDATDDDMEHSPGGARQASSAWSRRVRTGEHVENLVGLALSGGGIRSATFNLGVLQSLQELDILREVDYLSTVSGGGYIGAWLLGNVRRSRHWLSQLTSWNTSIEHLRRFSNYLAPRPGLMSVDTWTMWGSWVRNAMLIQVSAAAWVAALVIVVRLAEAVFSDPLFSWLAVFPPNLVLGSMLLSLTAVVVHSLRTQENSQANWPVIAFAVAPAWVGSFLTAAMLWATRSQAPAQFSRVLGAAWQPWLWPLVLLLVSFSIVALVSIEAGLVRAAGAVAAAIGAVTVAYLGMCGTWWLFGTWADAPDGVWRAYAAGGPLVLLSMTLAVVMLIGLVGDASPDWRREWWTRFGSWLGISGVAFVAMSAVSVFGPPIVFWVVQHDWPSVRWGTVVGWVGTIAGGLLAGGGDGAGVAAGGLVDRAKSAFAKLAAVLFIVGAALIAATVVHALLTHLWAGGVVGGYWNELAALTPEPYLISLAALVAVGLLLSWRFEINVFGLNQFYRNRLVRCYLGATRWRLGLRRPQRFTEFDAEDDLPLSSFRSDADRDRPYAGPFPIVNCALNLGGSSDLSLHTRHSASFVLTPLRAGADRAHVGYAQALGRDPTFAGGVALGQAISVSGAAASPNMGYHSSPLVAFLLTMFNVRLGWWFPNPGKRQWRARRLPISLWYLVKEMFARADERGHFVNVSDGGHFENLGIYELVRRRCKVIIACDAECDPALAFGSLGSMVRMCTTDFGATIDIDVESIRRQASSGMSRAHCAVGRITYANGSRGYLVYLKASISGDEDIGTEQYLAAHADFPHETTADQFFAEDQFESYRRLGHHIGHLTFRDVRGEPDLVAMAAQLAHLWVPASAGSEAFVGQTEALDRIWERFRTSPSLYPLLRELSTDRPPALNRLPSDEEFTTCLQLFQHMENVFLALRLDEFWTHPDNRGWVTLFRRWAKSQTFRRAWRQSRDLFGHRFVHFCHQRLGL